MNREPLIAVSRAMREIVSLLPRMAAATAPVVIEGETGTGKGRIAEAIHDMSPRREAAARPPHPVTVSCPRCRCPAVEPILIQQPHDFFIRRLLE